MLRTVHRAAPIEEGFAVEGAGTRRNPYRQQWRCLSTWWAPPPSKRVGRAIPVRRVRFPSTSASLIIRTGRRRGARNL